MEMIEFVEDAVYQEALAVLEKEYGKDPGEFIWTTREGVKMKVKDMTTSHLFNAINYFRKRGRCQVWWIIWAMELNRRIIENDKTTNLQSSMQGKTKAISGAHISQISSSQ